jgi:lipopolysaccharide/colanic/teichoic acid biosynthesis glycosyltransferase
MVVDLKRWFDLVFSSIAIGLFLLPASLVAALLIVNGQPVLVRRHRVGRNGRMLKLLEFPTSVADDGAMETLAGCEGEQPTRLGVYLRRFGIERWPWLLSVLKGDLSIVGPRAELPRYVGCYPSEVRKKVLSVKPGLIDLSSLEIREEQRLLQGLEGEALEEAYVEQVLPLRLAYAERYIETSSLRTDLTILLKTLFR